MFRTLLSYSVTAIGQSGQFSLQLHTNQDNSQVVLTFWSGNVFNNLLLAETPNSLMIAKEFLQIVSSFLAAFPSVPPLYSLLNTLFTINTESVQVPSVCVVWCLPFHMKIWTSCERDPLSRFWTVTTITAYYSFF